MINRWSNNKIFMLLSVLHFGTEKRLVRLKAGFHMIVDDRKEGCFHKIGNDRWVDWSLTFRSAEMSNVLARCARGKSKQTAWRTSWRKFPWKQIFLFLVLKRQQLQLQNRRKHRFWIRKYSIKFLADFFPTVRLFVFVFVILTIMVVNALIQRNYVQCQQMSIAINEHSGFMA